jgi:hypothetical protein
MANPYAVASTGQAILSLLASACPRADFPNAQFELYQARNFQTPMEEGIALYLHRITPANNVRNLPPRVAPDGRKFRPSAPIDLHYLIIAWARNAVKQHRLMGWAIRTIEDTPTLTAGVLNQPGPEADMFHPGESIDMIMETFAIQDMGSIWDVTKPNIPLAVAYTARILELDSSLDLTEVGAVQTRVLRSGRPVAV